MASRSRSSKQQRLAGPRAAARPGGHMQYGRGEVYAAVLAYLGPTGSSSERRGFAHTAAEYGIPESTLRHHVKEITSGRELQRPGRPGVLAADDTQWLVKWVKECAAANLPVSKQDIVSAAQQIADRRQRDGDGRGCFAGPAGRPGKNGIKYLSGDTA